MSEELIVSAKELSGVDNEELVRNMKTQVHELLNTRVRLEKVRKEKAQAEYNSGTSLLELLFVLLVIGFLLTVGLGAYSRAINNAETMSTKSKAREVIMADEKLTPTEQADILKGIQKKPELANQYLEKEDQIKVDEPSNINWSTIGMYSGGLFIVLIASLSLYQGRKLYILRNTITQSELDNNKQALESITKELVSKDAYVRFS
jgi:Tfp pilus assembly protein PilE